MIDLHCFIMLHFLCLSAGTVTLATASSERYEVQTIDAKVLAHNGPENQCPTMEETEEVLNEIHQIAYQAIISMTDYTCNGSPGWKLVAFINMTDTSYNCPTGLRLIESPKRICASPLRSGGCSSTTFSVGGLSYSRVCGRIRGYQFGVTDAFYSSVLGIESHYVDGVSLTHGGAEGRRQHIWTFASGLRETPDNVMNNCPCDNEMYNLVPEFVGNDFFCESAVTSSSPVPWRLFPNDVLWDGQNCTSNSTCCQLNNPPWFTKNLTDATTDDIELRLCTNFPPADEDVPIELIELYVQ